MRKDSARVHAALARTAAIASTRPWREHRLHACPGSSTRTATRFQRALRGRSRGRRLLGLARVDARRGRAADAGAASAASYARRLPRDARRRLHGGRRVPLPRASRRRSPPSRRPRRPGSSSSSCYAAYGRGGLDALPAGVASPSTCAQVEALRDRGRPRRARPPLRPRLPARLARGDRPLRRRARACRCTSTPTSSRARSRSASPSTASGRSSCSRETGCLGPRTTVVHATHADDAELDLLAEAGARVCVCPTTEANLGDGFAPVERAAASAGSASASAPTRTSASTRSRSCASSRASRAGRTLRRERHPARRRCSASAPTKAPRRSASTRGRTSRSTSSTRRSRGVDEADVLAALVFGCAADVFVES